MHTDSDTPPQDPFDEAARQQRIAALHALSGQQQATSSAENAPAAQDTTGAPPPTPPTTPTRSRRRRWVALGSAALALVLLVTGLLVWLRPAPPKAPTIPQPQVMVVNVPATMKGTLPINCPTEAAWSPDSARLAVLGWETCGDEQTSPRNALFAIYSYNAVLRSWKTSGSYSLVADIARSVVPESMLEDPNIYNKVHADFSHLTWAADGKQVAMLFVARPATPQASTSASAPQPYGGGVLVIDIGPTGGYDVTTYNTATPFKRMLPLVETALAQYATPASLQPASILRYETTTGQGQLTQLPPSLGYQWDGSTLTATQPLPKTPDAAPPAVSADPIGNPAGDASFSAWQQGVLTAGHAQCPGGEAYDLLALSSESWSPDGSTVAFGLGATGRLAGAVPTSKPGQTAACQALGPASHWTTLPVRDAGLRAARVALHQAGGGSLALAWRPDGRLLVTAPAAAPATGAPITATTTPGTMGTPLNASVLVGYDTQTGAVRFQVTLAQLKHGDKDLDTRLPVRISSLRWSPDGTQFVALDEAHHDLIFVKL